MALRSAQPHHHEVTRTVFDTGKEAAIVFGIFFNRTREQVGEEAYRKAIARWAAHDYAGALVYWRKCAESLPTSPIGLLARGMVWYEEAPEGSESGPAKEYREAVKAFGEAVLTSDQFFAIAVHYLADTCAKLGTGFVRGYETEQKVWRQCALQCWRDLLYGYLNGHPSCKTVADTLGPDVILDRFVSLRGFHERRGMDPGDLQLLDLDWLPQSGSEVYHRNLLQFVTTVQSHYGPSEPLDLLMKACVLSVKDRGSDTAALIRQAVRACG